MKSYREFKVEMDYLFRRFLTNRPPSEHSALKHMIREYEQLYNQKVRKYETCIENPETFSDECAKCYDGNEV